MEQGELVPDPIIIALMKKEIEKNRGSFVLDGFPRNLSQAKALDRENIKVDLVLNLEASEEVIVKRLSGRRICKDCGKIYHLLNMPPAKEGVCDICGGELYRREDDTPPTIRNRLKIYKKETEELLDFYKSKGVLESIDANGKAEIIYARIRDSLKQRSLNDK